MTSENKDLFDSRIEELKTKGEITFETTHYCKYGSIMDVEFKTKIITYENQQHHVFERSFKLGKTAGTGLGLYIVKKTIERYGGEITLKDNYPKGTIFEIRLKNKEEN